MSETSRTEPFGFEVRHETVGWMGEPCDLWTVCLPHQCDEWLIVGEKYGDGKSRASAVLTMEQFINEAQAALEKLQRGEADA